MTTAYLKLPKIDLPRSVHPLLRMVVVAFRWRSVEDYDLAAMGAEFWESPLLPQADVLASDDYDNPEDAPLFWAAVHGIDARVLTILRRLRVREWLRTGPLKDGKTCCCNQTPEPTPKVEHKLGGFYCPACFYEVQS